MTKNDFNMSFTDDNGTFVRVEEINEMIKLGIIKVDDQKLKEYRFDTRVQYDKTRYSKKEMMKLWDYI